MLLWVVICHSQQVSLSNRVTTAKKDVVISFIGDGATNNGYFHEALNMSAIWDLPVVWIIENNLVGMGTRIEDSSGQIELHKRAVAYNMKDMGRVNGQDVIEVYNTVSEAVAYAREHGPVLIESLTYRYKGHGVSDRSYDKRLEDELRDWVENKDPIKLLAAHLTSKYKNVMSEMKKIEREVDAVVAESVEFALKSPNPTYEDLINHVYVTG